MKKTNNVKANKVNAGAKQAKANNNAKTTSAKANKIDLTTIQLYDDISVTIETKTLDNMKSWAFHTYRELSEDCLHVGMAYEDGKTDNLISYTEDELKQIIVDAGLQLNLFDPNDDDRYVVTGTNVYESCMRIIDICKAYINALHGNYEAIGLVKPKFTRDIEIEALANQIVGMHEKLCATKSNIVSKVITDVPYTRAELCSITGVATYLLSILNKYDCSNTCNVEVTKYLCNEVINIVNDLLERIATDSTISCLDNKALVMSVYPHNMPKNTKTNPVVTDFEYDDF